MPMDDERRRRSGSAGAVRTFAREKNQTQKNFYLYMASASGLERDHPLITDQPS